MNRTYFSLLSLFCLMLLVVSPGLTADWPTYMHDNYRSGATNETLPDELILNWQYISAYEPLPAWPAPADTDYWHREANLKPRVIFDKALHVVSDGERVYFGSSANDKVYCLDAATGREEWSFFTEGPVRLAPTLAGDNLLVGSDGGSVYGLDAASGKLNWRLDAGAGKRKLLGNERMISISPVRSGVLVSQGIAYFTAGLFPNEGVELYAVDPETGRIIWRKAELDISPQGFLLASNEKLYIPTGRTTPALFDLKSGEKIGQLDGNGGTYALLNDDELVYGGGDLGVLDVRKEGAKDRIATFNGLQMIIEGTIAYLRTDTEILSVNRAVYFDNYKKWEKVADKRNDLAEALWDMREQRKLAPKTAFAKIDRKIAELVDEIFEVEQKQKQIEDKGILWKTPVGSTYSMILAGDRLYVGGKDRLFSLDKKTGAIRFSGTLEGSVYGLAAAGGRLFASTDNGRIYGFSGRKSGAQIRAEKVEDNPFPGGRTGARYRKAAREILELSDIEKGLCLVLDSEAGQLAYELAKQSQMKIVGIEDDADKVEKSRRLLDKAGLYGSRVAIIHADPAAPPFSGQLANLVVVDNGLKEADHISPGELTRLLRPFGGMALVLAGKESVGIDGWKRISRDFTWAVHEKGRPENAGEWTHLYANPANTACSLDPLKAPLQIQWFGRPGPKEMINRHSRPMSSLFKDGRLYIPADNKVICVDAYNGTPLWQQHVPDSRILGALKDCGHMAVTSDLLYVASSDKCEGFAVDTGERMVLLRAPQPDASKHDWGYLAVTENQVFGSGKKRGASFTILGRFNCTQFEGDYREMVTSVYLFSLDRHSGKELWRYKSGVVFNNTIAIEGDYLYLVESRNKTAVNDPDGRLRVDDFCKSSTFLVKLNKKSGEKLWEKPVKFPFDQIMYLSCSKGVVLVTGSYNRGKNLHYDLYAFDGESGIQKWQTGFKAGYTRWDATTTKSTIGGTHGEQWQHPVIIEENIYLPPYKFDLFTGKKGDLFLTRGGHGCGGLSGSASFLFARGSNPRIYDVSKTRESGTPLTRVNRPGCWINIIPAGNIVSIPESSSGCTCDYPIQTSFVFVPREQI